VLYLKYKKRTAIGPSESFDNPYFEEPYRAMTEEEIREIIQAFGDGARRAKEAGFDAVQVHGAHAYLLSQFLSPFTNRRNDAWGGPLENRLRFHQEVYKEIRSRVGEDYPVLIKIGVQDNFDGGLEFDEGRAAAEFLARLGFDALEISSGLRGKGYEMTEFPTGINRVEQEGYFREWCKEIKARVQVPVIMVGGLRSFEVMEEVIEKGQADLVSLSRPFIQIPILLEKENRACYINF